MPRLAYQGYSYWADVFSEHVRKLEVASQENIGSCGEFRAEPSFGSLAWYETSSWIGSCGPSQGLFAAIGYELLSRRLPSLKSLVDSGSSDKRVVTSFGCSIRPLSGALAFVVLSFSACVHRMYWRKVAFAVH